MQLIMVAKIVVAQMCNTVATNATPDGHTPFDVPLRLSGDLTNTVVAYWCCWTMTSAVATTIQTLLTSAGALAAETTIYTAGQTPPTINRIAIFNGASVSPTQVLTTLGLDILIRSV